MTMDSRSRWLALIVLCLGSLMIVLDTTIVNVALPSIKTSLGFSQTSLAWVVNAYLLTFGGFLLLGGRLGDLYGHRRLFLIGITLFTLASLSCGLANSEGFLVAARAVQGLGGAITSAVALSLIDDPVHRAGRAREGDGRLRLRRRRRRHDRRAARRRPDRRAQLALDLPRQRADRRRRLRACRCGCCRRRRGPAAAGRLDVGRRDHGDGCADARRLRDRERQPARAGRRRDARPARRCRRAAGRVRRDRGARALAARAARDSSGCATSRPRTSSACSGRPRCSPGSSCRRSTCQSCSATARSRSGSPSCRRT